MAAEVPPGIRKIGVENFLSFQKMSVDLQNLNVLVGPNGVGKTNLLSLIRFLALTARVDLAPAVQQFGGYERLFFRGQPSGKSVSISVEAVITKYATTTAPDSYKLAFWETKPKTGSFRFLQREEEFAFKRLSGPGRRIKLKGGSVNVYMDDGKTLKQQLKVDKAAAGLSFLRRLGDEYDASQVNELAALFENFRVFEVNVALAKRPSILGDTNSLDARARDLAPYLIYLSESYPEVFSLLQDDMRYMVPGLKGIHLEKIGGSAEGVVVELEEMGLSGRTPLAYASFGTIRALALLAMLHDPSPPRLTCVEEIDHGLHPHALDRLVDRLRDAARKTQLIVATHSPALVNRLDPAELIVLEKDEESGATRKPSVTPEEIKQMEQQSGLALGELWFSGTIGGSL